MYIINYLIFIGLLYGWGIIFILITTLVGVFKKEKDNAYFDDDHDKINVFQNYPLLWDILKLPSIRILAVILITSKVFTI